MRSSIEVSRPRLSRLSSRTRSLKTGLFPIQLQSLRFAAASIRMALQRSRDPSHTAAPTRSTRSNCWKQPPSVEAIVRARFATACSSYPAQTLTQWDETLGAFDAFSNASSILTIPKEVVALRPSSYLSCPIALDQLGQHWSTPAS